MANIKLFDEGFPVKSSVPVFGKFIRLWKSVLSKYVESIGLNSAQPPILGHLVMEPDLTQKELAERLNVTQASITMTVNRMEKAGLIIKTTDEKDSRKVRMKMTEKAFRLFIKVDWVLEEFDKMFFNGFTEEEKNLFLDLIRKGGLNLEGEMKRLGR